MAYYDYSHFQPLCDQSGVQNRIMPRLLTRKPFEREYHRQQNVLDRIHNRCYLKTQKYEFISFIKSPSPHRLQAYSKQKTSDELNKLKTDNTFGRRMKNHMRFITQIKNQWYHMFRFYLLFLLILFSISTKCAFAEDDLTVFDLQVKTWAEDCKKEVTSELDRLLSSGRLNMGQLFDTFYIPIPNTDPQKYRTQYDKYFDEVLQIILDKYLEKDKNIVFVVIVDTNGYLPTHNLKYSKPMTGDNKVDILGNRSKRMFNDKTGLAAARNTNPYYLQKYSRDTGETMKDLSVPIFIKEKHWGAIRFGYLEK
jgi:hypothetical protein